MQTQVRMMRWDEAFLQVWNKQNKVIIIGSVVTLASHQCGPSSTWIAIEQIESTNSINPQQKIGLRWAFEQSWATRKHWNRSYSTWLLLMQQGNEARGKYLEQVAVEPENKALFHIIYRHWKWKFTGRHSSRHSPSRSGFSFNYYLWPWSIKFS